MANFYFFTDKELILPQAEEDAFGRVKEAHLDYLFYVPSTLTNDPTGVFQKFPVFGGDSIGTFNKDSFGIEIVLNRMQFKEPLSGFREHRHHIKIGALPLGYTLLPRYEITARYFSNREIIETIALPS